MKLDPKVFLDFLLDNDICFFSGVPDSTLKHFCFCIEHNIQPENHVICANEGNAIGIGIGYHLSTGMIPAVYLQNSGLGNIINPLVSIADPEVYSIPMLLIVGWRGMPGTKDEPQHKKQGRITLELLDVLGIYYVVVDEDYSAKFNKAVDYLKKESKTVALIFPKGVIDKYQRYEQTEEPDLNMSREDAIGHVIDSSDDEDIVVSTTGMASRELYEFREKAGMGHERDFLTVGGMGHASQIALGIALQKGARRTYCLDGDGAFIMHMGASAVNGFSGCSNFIHIVLNNGAHDSVGGQPTLGFKIKMEEIARAAGYRQIACVRTAIELKKSLKKIRDSKGPSFIEILVKKGNRENLGRPTTTPIENKADFMEFLK